MDYRQKIKEKIDEACILILASPDNKSAATWTKGIFKPIVQLGKDFGFSVFAADCDHTADGSEWLYDLCWLRYPKSGNEKPNLRDLKCVELALESEWANSIEVSDDFQKLIQAKALTKVMIFEKKKESKNDLFLELKTYAERFPVAFTEYYLLSCYFGDKKQFEHQQFEVHPK
jgi:hypothetical protein